jgi:subtilisin family serine protease
VHVYVLDTGIRTTHQEFKTADGKGIRAFHSWSAFDGSSDDCHSHGTHVAAVIGGEIWESSLCVLLMPVAAVFSETGTLIPSTDGPPV